MNLLNESCDSKFAIRNWNTVNNQSNANYDVENEIIYNDYHDTYILVTGNITIWIKNLNGRNMVF